MSFTHLRIRTEKMGGEIEKNLPLLKNVERTDEIDYLKYWDCQIVGNRGK